MEFLTRQESQDSSSLSSAAAISSPGGASFNSDEDTSNLAINRPKKRAGRKIFKETRHPIYRGVRRRNGNKWVCELREPNKKTLIWLGTYPTLEMAARAHDVAALALRGKSACLNFADSAWKLPVPASADAVEIRRVAGEAAEMFRTEEFGGCYRNFVVEDQSTSEEVISEELINCRDFEESSSSSNGVNHVFVDEEEMFEMPRLIEELAEGLLLSPPYFDGEIEWNRLENHDYNGSLWSY